MKELSVYKQMTMSPNECLSAIKREIGLKITCVPFAVKVMDALKTLKINTDDDAIKAANTLLSGLQTLWQGYEYIDVETDNGTGHYGEYKFRLNSDKTYFKCDGMISPL